MKQKDIDIYEILKDVERGTELYTPKCGRVYFSGMANNKDSAFTDYDIENLPF